MAFMPLLWAALVGVIVWAVVRLTQPTRSGAPESNRQQESAREILDRRFASGEIDHETYGRMRDKLTAR